MPKIARSHITAHMREPETDPTTGATRQRIVRTLKFERGETVPDAWLPFIDADRLAEPGQDLDSPDAPTEAEILAARRRAYDKLNTVDDVNGWINGTELTERADVARFAIAMEQQGKQRVGILQHAQKVLEVLGEQAIDQHEEEQRASGPVIVDGNAEPEVD